MDEYIGYPPACLDHLQSADFVKKQPKYTVLSCEMSKEIVLDFRDMEAVEICTGGKTFPPGRTGRKQVKAGFYSYEI